MAEKGAEPGTEASDERIGSPFARIMAIPGAEVETDCQGLVDQIYARNCVILHARLGRGKNGLNIAVASLEGNSGREFFFLAGVEQGRVIRTFPAKQMMDIRLLGCRVPFRTDWCREDGARRGSSKWDVTG